MRSSKALTACAVLALAMVFSVQQGEHGPLVVYKLAVPPSAAPAAPAPALPAGAATVVIEDPTAAAPAAPQAAPLAATFGGMPLQAPDSAAVYRTVEEMQDSGVMINGETGGALTLKQVNDAIAWRRDTAEKLRQVPIAPRF